MKVVRACEARTYRQDGNRLASHSLTFGLACETPRGAGKVSARIDFRCSNGKITVGDLRLTLPGNGAGTEIVKSLELAHEIELPELIELADGIKAAAAVAVGIFETRPPEREKQHDSQAATQRASTPDQQT